MKTRRSKTVSQQCRYYEVENIFDYMVSVYINGNITRFREMFKELNQDARKQFIEYCFSEANPQYSEEIILATIQ